MPDSEQGLNEILTNPPSTEAKPNLAPKHEAKAAITTTNDTTTPSITTANPSFSIFSHFEKKWISSIASFGAMFSTLSSYIYFPALTVTSYLIVAGVAPEFMGDLADQGGRRPAYILMFILVVGSNIGLALTRSFAGLFVLRMVQSAGASGDIYHLDYLQAGLIYLSSGIGGGIATYSTGRFLDRNIKKYAAIHGRDGGCRRGDDISDFPIEKARFVGIYSFIAMSAVGTAAYGVSLMERTHIAVPLIIQFLTGATTSSLFTLCGTLLTDLNPEASATVQASYNPVGCILASLGIAIQQPLANAAGAGWCFGIFGFIMFLALPLAWMIQRYGLVWRKKKVEDP